MHYPDASNLVMHYYILRHFYSNGISICGARRGNGLQYWLIPPSSSQYVCIRHMQCSRRKVLVPVEGRLSGNPKRLSDLQRMGVGLIIGLLAMAAACVTEIRRLKRIVPGQGASNLTIFWQVPQYVLVGASEVFKYVGLLDFFNGQAPDGIKSFGSSLCMASMSLGNCVSRMLVNIVMKVTTTRDGIGWIPDDLNTGHLDRFFFMIAGFALSILSFMCPCTMLMVARMELSRRVV